jgi:hypothetical protein
MKNILVMIVIAVTVFGGSAFACDYSTSNVCRALPDDAKQFVPECGGDYARFPGGSGNSGKCADQVKARIGNPHEYVKARVPTFGTSKFNSKMYQCDVNRESENWKIELYSGMLDCAAQFIDK